MIDGLAHSDAAILQASHRPGKLFLRCVGNAGSIEPGRARSRTIAILAIPVVQTEMMVIPTGGDKRRRPVEGNRFKPESISEECVRASGIGHLKVNVPEHVPAGAA